MSAPVDFFDRLQTSLSQFWDLVPALIGAAAVLFAGYLVATLVQKGAARVLRRIHLNEVLRRGGVMRAAERGGTHVNPTRVVAGLLFWFVMFATVLIAASALGLDSLAQVFSELMSYIPSVIGAIVILILGLVLGDFVSGLIAVSTGTLHGGPTLARAGKGGVILIALFMALQELGVATGVVTTAFAIVFGAIALAFALAFGLGNRDLAAEVTRAWYKRYRAEREAIDREEKIEEVTEGLRGKDSTTRVPVHTPVTLGKRDAAGTGASR